MSVKITKKIVDQSTQKGTVWDSEIKGFGLRISAKGARSYVVVYRSGGRQRWYTIGRHGSPWTPDTARNEAKKVLGEVAQGGDPAEEKRKENTSERFSDFAERYLTEYSAVHKKQRTQYEERRALELHVLPALGRIRVQDITRDQVQRIHSGLADRPYRANRILAVLRHMFNIAEDWELRPQHSNPCLRIKQYREKSRERFLSPRELRKLGRALAVVDRGGQSIYEVAAIRLLMFTGARLSEILELEWSFVDLDSRVLRLPDSKTGAKSIPLSPPAIEVLMKLPRQHENPYVICGKVDGAHLVNLQKPWTRIRKAAGLSDVRLHDLRHLFASIGVSSGMSLPLIGSLLGHTQTQTTQRYAHLHDDPRLAAADAIAGQIAASLSGNTGEVISFEDRHNSNIRRVS